jgi:hypothetical protein
MAPSARAGLFQDIYPRDLTTLLSHIHTGKVALPDFQRNFVWDPAMTQELIVSMAEGTYAGSVLCLPNTEALFAWREFQGAPALNGGRPAFLVLDGQQRLTSLYQAFHGVGEYRYYLNLRRLLDGEDFETCLFHLGSHSKQAQAYEAFDLQAQQLVLPLTVLKNGLSDFRRWSQKVARTQSQEGERDILEEALGEVDERWMQPIASYQFSVVTLSETTSAEAVCRMFEKLHLTGIRLSPFELLTARFWPKQISLRRLWEKAQDGHPIIADFLIDPYYIVQIISLVTSSPPLCTRKHILTLQPGTIAAWWDRTVESLARALEILRDDCGVIAPKWLPYSPLVMPLAAVLAKLTQPVSPQAGAIRQKLARWFWCSVFRQTYEQGSNSQAARDVGELLAWCAGGIPPESVRAFQFDPQLLREATTRQSALYCGTMCLILSRGPRDVYSGAKLRGELITGYRIDDHHVFPRAYLDRHGMTARLRDCVLNRTLIVRTTNKSLHTRAPADYLEQIRRTLGAGTFQELLQSHLLPSEPDSPLWRNDFERFLARRQEMVWQEIQRVTGLSQATPMLEDLAPPLSSGAHKSAHMTSSQEHTSGPAAWIRTLPSLEGYLEGQSDRIQRLLKALDQGIRALAPDIEAQTTKGRWCVGGVSYYSPERYFFRADFLQTGDGLTLSVFTGGQRWEGLNPSRSEPWGSYVIRTEADLPVALTWAKASYEARKRAL